MSPFDSAPRWTAATRDRLVDAADRRGGAFLLEGRKTVLDALLRKDLRVREVWIADDLDEDAASSVESAAAARGLAVGRGPAREVARVSDTVTPQGVLAVADDVARPVADVLRGSGGPCLLLDRVQDPGNVGAILRVAAAFGCRGVLVATGTADPLGGKALRASAGTSVAVPIARGTPADLLAAAAKEGYALWLLDATGDPLWDAGPPPDRLLLAVGSEGAGAGPDVARAAARRISIPIAPAAESLNAAVAAGIAVAHLARGTRSPSPRGGAGR